MPLNTAALDVAGEAIAAAITHVQFHTASSGAAGTTAIIPGGRFPIDIESTNGNLSLAAPVNATGLTPGASVAFVSFHGAATGGPFYGDAARTTGDAAVNAAGEYTLNTLSIPASAS